MEPDKFAEKAKFILLPIVLIGMAGLIARSIMFPEPPVPLSTANGSYANALCGTLTFHDGVLSWGASSAHYVLEKDKNGLLALTDYFVGTTTTGGRCYISADHSKYALFLRFNRETEPTVVTVYDVRLLSYQFTRTDR